MPGRDEVIRHLAGLGSLLQVHGGPGGAAIGPRTLAESACRGACVDWARRAIQRSRPPANPAPRLRQPPGRPEHHTRAADELRDVLNVDPTRFNWDAIPDSLWDTLRSLYDFSGRPTNVTRRYLADLLERVSRDSSVALAPVYPSAPTEWRSFAQLLARRHDENRSGGERRTPSRPFTGIDLVESTERRSRGSMERTVADALEHPQLTPGRVAVLSFGLREGARETGHAVAVRRVSMNEYHLFEPNFGVFRYDRDAVARALQYLFGDSRGATPVYGEGGLTVTGQMSTMIFDSDEG